MTETQRARGPLLLGLTGGIGAGKSTVAALFRARGAGIVDADAIAREVVEPGEPALRALVAEFGAEVLAEDGALDRAALAASAFASPAATQALNAIMHPAISERTAVRLAELQDRPVVVHDVPLLVENGLTAQYHLSVLIDVPEEVRLERLTTLRGLDRDDAQRRIRAQATDEQRRRACDARLDNAGTPDALEERFARLWDARLEPFRRNRAAGRPAEPLPGSVPDDQESRDAAAERLRVRLVHAAERVGIDCAVAAESGPDGTALVLRPGIAAAQATASLLLDAGYAPTGPARDSIWATADPGQPARVTISAVRAD